MQAMLNTTPETRALTEAVIGLLGYTSQVMGSDFSKLKDALKRADMTQADLAREVGVTRGAVSLWVTNRATPSLGHLLAISKALNMTLSEILGDEVLVAETKTEREIIETLRELNEEERRQLVAMALFLAQQKKAPKPA